jgi:hypothetical protein
MSIQPVPVRVADDKPAGRAGRSVRKVTDLKQYLLSIYQPEGDPPPPEVLEPIMRDIGALNAELRVAGAWVFTGGLYPPDTATVLRAADGGVVVTDGPYAEGKEHIGGFWVIRAPDLDAALGWARKATQACTLPVEVRPMVDMPGD